MFNFLDKIRSAPGLFKQLSVDDQLVTEFNCPIETRKEAMWSDLNYFAYVIEGKKVWHVPGKSFELTQDKCIFVKKGAHIIEQFFDAKFCVIVFFVTDEFITGILRDDGMTGSGIETEPQPVYFVDSDDSLQAFFQSVVPYFHSAGTINKSLLALKFRELVMNVVHNNRNLDLTNYLRSLLTTSKADLMRKVMEENFHYNLKLEEYARICGRSLSAFKRDFEEYFKTSPGKWLLNRRLQQAQLLLNTSSKSISEVAFESGFENASHFSRSFKEFTGTAPVSWRKKPA